MQPQMQPQQMQMQQQPQQMQMSPQQVLPPFPQMPQQPQQQQQQQQQVHAPQPARVSGTSLHPPGDVTDARYLEAVWQLSEVSLEDKGKLDPPASGQPQLATLGEAFTATSTLTAGASEEDWRVGVPQPATVPSGQSGASGGPAVVWNSFDDAAAKGMVDGLVGREDCMPPVTAWRNTTHAA